MQLTHTESKQERFSLYNKLAEEALYYNPKESLKYASKAVRLAKESDDKNELATAYLNTGIALRHLGRNEESLQTYYKILRFIDEIKDKELTASILNQVGIVHYKLGHDTLSLKSYKKSLDLRQQMNDIQGVNGILNNLGNLYNGMGNYPKALDYFFKCLQYDESKHDTIDIAISYNNIGLVYQNMRDYRKSIQYFSKALHLIRGRNQELKEASLLNNLGASYVRESKYDSAIDMIAQSNKIYSKHGLEEMKRNNYTNMGMIYMRMGDLNKSLELLHKALSIDQASQNSQYLLSSYINIGKVLYLQGKYNEALHTLKKAEEKLQLQRDLRLANHLMLAFANLYHQLGDDSKAYNYFTEYYAIKDSIFALDREEISARIEAQYESSKQSARIESLRKDGRIKELEIERDKNNIMLLWVGIASLVFIVALVTYLMVNRYKTSLLLKSQNEEIKEKNEIQRIVLQQLQRSENELRISNDTKDKFFSIIAHDLKNPLLALKSLLFSMNNRKEPSFQEMKLINNQLNDSLNDIIFLLNNLLKWSMAQRNQLKPHQETININELIQGIMESHKKACKIKDIRLSHEFNNSDTELLSDRNMLEFMLRNLLSNAIKFTTYGGTISLKNYIKEENYLIEIHDTGIGMPQEEIEKLFQRDHFNSNPGTNNESGSGLGLKLCYEFAKLLHGEIKVESEEGKGSCFTIILPLKSH